MEVSHQLQAPPLGRNECRWRAAVMERRAVEAVEVVEVKRNLPVLTD